MRMKLIGTGLTLLLAILAVTKAFPHTDPPTMKLTMYPAMPAKGQTATVKISLKGTNTGIPLLGAKIRIVLSDEEGKSVSYKADPTEKPGLYIGNISFPKAGMWTMKIDVLHMNELDYRKYMVYVTESAHGAGKEMVKQARLAMDKTTAHQLIPPMLLLEGYVLLILVLLGAVTLIKRVRRSPIS